MAKTPRKPPRFRIRYTKSLVDDNFGSARTHGGDGASGWTGSRNIRMHIHNAVTEASRGKIWWYRVPLLLPFAWILFRHLMDSEYGSVFAGINLAIHEGGHLFFMWFGIDFLTVAGGTMLRCLCPILTGIMFYR
jgi:hypothetical protein